MKRRLTLAQKLTGSIAIAVVLQIVLLIVAFAVYFKPQLEKSTRSLMLKGTTASGYQFLYRHADAIFQAVKAFDGKHADTALEAQFREIRQQSRFIAGLGLYRISPSGKTVSGNGGGEADKNRRVGSNSVKTIAEQFGPPLPGAVRIFNMDDYSNPIRIIDQNYVFSGIPVQKTGNDTILLLYVESVTSYSAAGRKVSQGLFLVIIVFFLFLLVYVFWVGARIGRPLKALAETTAQIASGDLTRKMTIGRGAVAEITELSNSIQGLTDALHRQVALIKSITQQAAKVSQGVARATSRVASSASEQAAAVSETASTVEEMERTASAVLASVRRIVEAADKSAQVSNRGRESVGAASTVIRTIRDDSSNIAGQSRAMLSHVEEVGNIINSVNAIAEQSKILAVNASIEAAKAGEYGFGFAVVAQEVKILASQSKDATEQITRTLTAIRHAVETMVRLSRDGEQRTRDGVSAIANTGAIVNDLGDAIQEASIVANEIDAAVSQQSVGLSQIAAAMDEINISASENQEIATIMNSNADRMKQTIDELAVLVDVWDIDQTTSSEKAG